MPVTILRKLCTEGVRHCRFLSDHWSMAGPDRRTELSARERRWLLLLMLVGAAGLIVVGVVLRYWPPLAAGVVLAIVFGGRALGARRTRAGAGPVSADTAWSASDPSPGPRKIYLPTDPERSDQDD